MKYKAASKAAAADEIISAVPFLFFSGLDWYFKKFSILEQECSPTVARSVTWLPSPEVPAALPAVASPVLPTSRLLPEAPDLFLALAWALDLPLALVLAAALSWTQGLINLGAIAVWARVSEHSKKVVKNRRDLFLQSFYLKQSKAKTIWRAQSLKHQLLRLALIWF